MATTPNNLRCRFLNVNMDMIQLIIATISGFVIGFGASMFWISTKIRRTLEDLAHKAGMTYEEYNRYLNNIAASPVAAPEASITIFTEQQDRTIFAYDFQTKNFICQAYSIEELAKNCVRFKNIKHAVVFHDGKVVYFIEGDVFIPS